MQLEQIVAEWLAKAEMDLSSAMYLSKMKPLPKEIIGFHCQQAIEKCMKSLFVYFNKEPPRIHNLLTLKQMLDEFISIPNIDISILAQLTPFAVEFRYPMQIELEDQYVLEVLDNTSRLYEYFKVYILNILYSNK
jgi:HEPN domain-containing protein